MAVPASIVLCLLLGTSVTLALENGLSRTPPMGWLAWERFRCITNCTAEPKNCISEDLFLSMATRLHEDGWAELGYDRVNIDDCWPLHQRDYTGKLVADPQRFPHGIKWLADQVHGMNVKLGIYGDYGTKTCGGYPGTMGYLRKDAETFAEWGIDSYKLDGCYAGINFMDEGYAEAGKALNKTGRPFLYSCSWPDYQRLNGMKVDYGNIARHCNLWRNFDDIQDSWDSVTSIINFYGDPQNYATFGVVNGPGQWNDPDMLLIGDFSLSYEQSKAQFAFWCFFSAPLFMSNDLREMSPDAVSILKNKKLIAINQDPAGKMARRVRQKDSLEVWYKDLADGSKAVILWNRSTGGVQLHIDFNFEEIAFPATQAVTVEDLYAVNGTITKHVGSYGQFVNPSGGVAALRLTPVQSKHSARAHIVV